MHNLKAWWEKKPNATILTNVIKNATVKNINEILEGFDVKIGNTDYRLEELKEGIVI